MACPVGGQQSTAINHPQLNAALIEQTQRMAHVMFGGLTHAPAVEATHRLVQLARQG